MKRATVRRTKIESDWYLNGKIVEEISHEKRREMETEKETEKRELEGWREWLIPLLRVHIFSPPPVPSLKPRLSAPGFHTRGASHPIITLKWLLPHQWRTREGWPQQWSSACFTALVTFPKLALQQHRGCEWRQHLSNCCDFLRLWLGCCIVAEDIASQLDCQSLKDAWLLI